jgi:hypothetical protein
MRWIKCSLKPNLVREAIMKCHSNLSKALVRSSLRKKAWEDQLLRVKECMISYVRITLEDEDICLLDMKAD